MAADDVTGAGKIRDLREWWDNVIVEGEKIGCYVNENKSWLILKDPSKLDQVKETFSNTQIKITVEEKRHLVAVVGNDDFRKHLANRIVEKTGNKYENVLTLIRTKLSFLIMKSALLCVRGSRAVGSKNQNTFDDDFDIIFEELRLS